MKTVPSRGNAFNAHDRSTLQSAMANFWASQFQPDPDPIEWIAKPERLHNPKRHQSDRKGGKTIVAHRARRTRRIEKNRIARSHLEQFDSISARSITRHVFHHLAVAEHATVRALADAISAQANATAHINSVPF